LSSSDNSQIDPQAQSPLAAESQPPVPAAPDSFSPTSYTTDLSGVPIAPAATPPPPAESPVFTGRDVLLITGLAFITILVLQTVVLFVAHAFFYPRLELGEVAQQPIVLLVSQILVYIPIAACMVLLIEGKYRVAFWQAIRWNWPRSEWKWLALGAVMLFVLAGLETILPLPKDTPFEHLFDRQRDALLLALIVVSIGPLMEELFFRGLMYPVLARRIGTSWGIVLTALPFGLIHLPQYGWAWGAALVISLVGVVCGVVRAATKSVAASFLVHVGYNGTQMLIALVYTHGFRHMDKAVAVPVRLILPHFLPHLPF
jgi:membrane protease YdiL (CAAX protease family)